MIYIDTGAFIARYVKGDQHHDEARETWASIAKNALRIFTSNFVLDETLTLLARRSSYEFSAQTGRLILASRAISVLRPIPADELEALRLFEKFADQKVSFTDCVSFVLMRRNRLTKAFSFDHHFTQAGFTLYP